MLSIKFGHGLYTAPWPRHVLWFWFVVGCGTAVSLAVWQLVRVRRGEREGEGECLGIGLQADVLHSEVEESKHTVDAIIKKGS